MRGQGTWHPYIARLPKHSFTRRISAIACWEQAARTWAQCAKLLPCSPFHYPHIFHSLISSGSFYPLFISIPRIISNSCYSPSSACAFIFTHHAFNSSDLEDLCAVTNAPLNLSLSWRSVFLSFSSHDIRLAFVCTFCIEYPQLFPSHNCVRLAVAYCIRCWNTS